MRGFVRLYLLTAFTLPTFNWDMVSVLFLSRIGYRIVLKTTAIDAFFPSCQFIKRDAISCCSNSDYDYDSSSAYDATTKGDELHRLLGGGGDEEICKYPLLETDNPAGCDYNKYMGVHIAHSALFWTTIFILSVFELELLFLVYLIGPKIFCKQLTYVVDLTVVTLSLSLELLFKYASEEILSVLPGILIVFRLWRFVRIGHGEYISGLYWKQKDDNA